MPDSTNLNGVFGSLTSHALRYMVLTSRTYTNVITFASRYILFWKVFWFLQSTVFSGFSFNDFMFTRKQHSLDHIATKCWKRQLHGARLVRADATSGRSSGSKKGSEFRFVVFCDTTNSCMCFKRTKRAAVSVRHFRGLTAAGEGPFQCVTHHVNTSTGQGRGARCPLQCAAPFARHRLSHLSLVRPVMHCEALRGAKGAASRGNN